MGVCYSEKNGIKSRNQKIKGGTPNNSPGKYSAESYKTPKFRNSRNNSPSKNSFKEKYFIDFMSNNNNMERSLHSDIKNIKEIPNRSHNYKKDDIPVKIMQKSNSINTENDLVEIEKMLNINSKNNLSNECLYIINDEQENAGKVYSSDIEYHQNIKTNLKDKNKLTNNLLSLSERNWYNELNDLSERLIKTREKFELKIFVTHLQKIIKIYEDFNWIIDSISSYYINVKYKNTQFNNAKEIDLPDVNSESWIKGFKWKGLYIKINDGDKNKTIIHEIKALNYFFFDYLQIIDKYQFKKENQLSNLIIFPLIGYSIINGQTLTVSALINVDNNNNLENIEIIKKNNGIIKLYSDLKNNNINNNLNNEKYNDIIDNDNNLISSMGKRYYINDLLISKLFYNLTESHFLKIKNDKYIIFNLHKLIPDLFQINFDFIQKINFFSKIKNKRIFYSLNYDTKNKINIHQKLSKYKNPKEVLKSLYYMNYSSSIKTKDIVINNIYFRILYENKIQNFDDLKNNSSFSKNFIDNLFNYNYVNKNVSIKTIIKEPYIIIYDLIEPAKIKYSLIKSNKNYAFDENQNKAKNNIGIINDPNGINSNASIEKEKEKDKENKVSKRVFYLESNFLSFFMSWCKSLSQNAFNMKSYSDLKQYMNKYGINSVMRFFSLAIIDNEEIADIIKISLLVKAIKFIFNKENNNNLNKNEEEIKNKLYKYIKSILYPSEILPNEQSFFDSIFRELVFYANLLFLKLKLIDYYLNLELLSLGDIKDQNINVDISFNTLKEEKMKVISQKLTGLNSPETFLIHIISIARKKPFLFLSELEYKLNFLINPNIKFKSSLSIESMRNQLDVNHIKINYNYKTFSYIKSNELSGLILAKIIARYNSYEMDGSNFFNKLIMIENALGNKINEIEANQENEIESTDSYIKSNMSNFPPSMGDSSPSLPDLFMISRNINMNKTYEENLTINSELSKEYTTDDNQSIYLKKENDNKTSDSSKNQNNKNKNLNCNQKNEVNSNNNYKVDTKIGWDNIKNEFLFELPSICYKMNYVSVKLEKNHNKINNMSLYKNLSNLYNIINPKIITEWGEILEEMLSNIYSCNGNNEHTLLYSLFYLFIYHFFFEKKRKECNILMRKIHHLYHNGGYQLSLNDLIIINLFKSLLINDYIKSEENFSKTIMLIFLSYGEPRGRNNDSHGILEFPLWKLSRKIMKFEQITLSENFREMFHTLDYFEWKKSLLRNKYNLCEKNNIINYSINAMNNLNEILLINNINKLNFTNNSNDNEAKLCEKIFDERILELKIIKHFNFPKLTDFNDKVNNIFETKEFILYLMKQIKSLFLGNRILLDQNYINSEISNEIFNPEKEMANFNNNIIPINDNKRFNIKNNLYFKNYNEKININDNSRYNGIIKESQKNNRDIRPFISNGKISNNSKYSILSKNSKQFKRPASGGNIKHNNLNGNLFSHFLYKELLEKLSYSHNMPSGVVFSFGNNRHNETSHDNLNMLTLPRIIFKLKNEYVDKIYSGWEHNIVLNKQGEIFSFGHNNNFQCGLPINNEKNCINNPTNISKINGNIKAISAACGNEHTLILKDDNSVYGFGINEEGELGLKDKNIKTYKLNKINFGKYSNQITQISAGTVHNLALTKDGRVFSWGSSQGGQLGLSEEYLINKPGFKETLFLYEPTLIHINKSIKINSQNKIKNQIEINENDDEFIIKISCGEAHSLALSSKGDVYSWGFGSNGQLGLGFCGESFEPGLSAQMSRKFTPQYLKSLEDSNIKDIQCGKTFTMFINDKKEVLACGVNDLSQLGIKDFVNVRKNDNICYDLVWPTVLDYLIDKQVQKISCGEAHCLAIVNYPENVKSIWSWGNNKFGQLGHGSWIDKSLPKPINFLLGFNNDKVQFEEISCGGFHSLCLIKYKEDLSWIEDDFKAIVDTINSNDNFITSNLNSPEDIKSENIPHINKFKFNF